MLGIRTTYILRPLTGTGIKPMQKQETQAAARCLSTNPHGQQSELGKQQITPSPTVLNRGNKTMYQNVDKSFDVENAVSVLRRKAMALPAIMDRLCALPAQYMRNIIGAKDYAAKHLDFSVPFYKDIEYRQTNDPYLEKYSKEISMIRGLSKPCNDLNLGNISVNEFNAQIEPVVDKYVSSFKKLV